MGKMTHPDVEGIGTFVDDAAFVVVWEPRGWKRLDEVEAAASELLGRTVADVGRLKRPELEALAGSLNIDTSGLRTNADLHAAIAAAQATETPEA